MPVFTALTTSERPGKRASASAAPAGTARASEIKVAVPETCSEAQGMPQMSRSAPASSASAWRVPLHTRSMARRVYYHVPVLEPLHADEWIVDEPRRALGTSAGKSTNGECTNRRRAGGGRAWAVSGGARERRARRRSAALSGAGRRRDGAEQVAHSK